MAFEKIRQFYYSLEEKWYSFLDKVNEKIPVYGVIDEIDKVVPSFIVFLALIALLLAGLFALFLFPAQATYTFRVVDEENNPLQGISVKFVSGDFEETIETDAFGEISLNLPSQNVTVSVQASGFDDFSTQLIAKKDSKNEIVLKKPFVQFEKKFLTILDSSGNILTGPSIVAFACSSGILGPSPASQRVENGSEFFVNYSTECGELSATVSSAGFKDTSVVLSGTRNQVRLEPLVAGFSSGNIVVIVTDKQSGQPVSQATVKLVSVFPFEKEVNQGRTDSGGAYSFEALPGTYFVSVSDLLNNVYKSGKSQNFELTENEARSISVELEKNTGTKTKLLLKVVDKATGNGVVNAGVSIFDGNILREKKSSGSNGTVTFLGLEEGREYSALVTHSNYVLKVFENILPTDDFSQQEQVLEISEADSTNSGSVKVRVLADGEPLSSAKVFLRNPDYDFSLLDGLTDSNGVKIFNNLAPAAYFALTETASHYGSSEQGILSAGSTLELEINLLLKEGFIVVKVFDKNAVVLQDASVKVVDIVSGEILKEAVTGVFGETEKMALPYNRALYVQVSSSGFLPFYSKRIILSPNSTHRMEVSLYRENEISSFDILLQRVLEEDQKKAASSFAKEKSYFLEFNLVVPASTTLSSAEAVVRTGLQSEVFEKDSNFVITGVERPLSGVGAVFSSCFDLTDDFAACSPVNGNSKQVELTFGELNAGVYEFLVKVFVKPTVLPKELLELRYGAKGVLGTQTIRKPGSGLYLKQFVLGEPVFCDKGPPTCPSFGYIFNLSDTTGLHFDGIKNLSPLRTEELLVGLTYSLDYTVVNWSRPRLAFTNFNINFSDSLATNAVGISPQTVLVPVLEPDTSFHGPPLSLQTISSFPLVELKTMLDVPVADNSTTLLFSVQPKKFLEVTAVPDKINASVYNYLTVTIKDDGTGESVNNAVIKVSTTEDFIEPLLIHSTGGLDGQYLVEVPPVSADLNVYLLAEAFNYHDSNVLEIEVSDTLPLFDLSEERVECLQVDDGTDDGMNEIQLIHGQKATFSVKAESSCPEPVEVYVFQAAASEPLTLENLSTLAILTDSERPGFVLNPGEEIDLRVSGDRLLGEYGLFVQSKFFSDKEFRDNARISVIVLPPSLGDLSCYSISKTSFNILPRDGGIISNNCAVFSRNAFYPKISLNVDDALLDSQNQKVFERVDFKATQRIFGSLNELGMDSRKEKVKVEVKGVEGEVLIADEEEVVQNAFLQVLTTIGPLIANPQVLGFIKSNPYVLILMVFLLVDDFFGEELGDLDNATCSQCKNSASVQESILLGNVVEKVEITGIVFDEGGYLKVNGDYVGIPELGPNPEEEEQEEQASENTPTGQLVLPTGLQGLPFGGGTAGAGAGGASGGFDIQRLLGGFGGGGGNPLSLFQSLLGPLFGQTSPPPENRADSCGGHRSEAGDCSELKNLEASSSGIDLDLTATMCTEIGLPLDVTEYFVGNYNPVDLFVCNKINDGRAEVEFTITDSVDISIEKDYFFVPQQDIVEEIDVLAPEISTYFTGAGPNAALSMSFSDNSENTETFFDGRKLKTSFVQENNFSFETPFEVLNTRLEGEKFAVVSFDSFGGKTPQNTLDIAYIVDSSKSFENEWVSFCDKSQAIEQELSKRNLQVQSKVYSIGEVKECADEKAEWGDPIQPTEENILTEAWGPALQDVSRANEWRENAKKLVIVFTDTVIGGENDDSVVQEEVTQSEESVEEQEEEPSFEELLEEITGGTGGAAVGTILSNTIAEAVDNNISVGFVFGVPLENDAVLTEFDQVIANTGGFVLSFQSQGDEKIIADEIIRSLFELKHTEFHVRLIGGEEQLCRGPNDEVGVTGASALPSVLFSWEWEKITESTCDQSLDITGVYCDAVQFSKELVKKLVRVRQLSSEGEFGEVNSLTSFNAFLLRDSFSGEFFTDFDEYVTQKEFFPLADYSNDWRKYLSNGSRFFVTIEGSDGKTLPASGLYQVNLRLSFDDAAWVFFDEQNEPKATIEVRLKLLEELGSENPFYSLPFDGMVGVNDNAIERNGYGVGFSGETVEIFPQTETESGLVSYPSASLNGLVLAGIGKETSFDYVNRQNRGVLLEVSKNGPKVNFVFSPSNATPVMLEVVPEQGKAHYYFEVKENGEAVSLGDYLNTWTGTASSVLECKDFEGNDLPLGRPDSLASASSCALRPDASPLGSYGFSWNAANDGRIFLKSIFYTPSNDYTIQNACQNSSLLITPSASSSEAPLSLDFTGSIGNLTLAGIFDLVREEKVCISESNHTVRFWWNKEYIYGELEESAQNYFNQIRTIEENLKQCVVG